MQVENRYYIKEPRLLKVDNIASIIKGQPIKHFLDKKNIQSIFKSMNTLNNKKTVKIQNIQSKPHCDN